MPEVGEPVDQERREHATNVTHGGADEDSEVPEGQEPGLTCEPVTLWQ